MYFVNENDQVITANPVIKHNIFNDCLAMKVGFLIFVIIKSFCKNIMLRFV